MRGECLGCLWSRSTDSTILDGTSSDRPPGYQPSTFIELWSFEMNDTMTQGLYLRENAVGTLSLRGLAAWS